MILFYRTLGDGGGFFDVLSFPYNSLYYHSWPYSSLAFSVVICDKSFTFEIHLCM